MHAHPLLPVERLINRWWFVFMSVPGLFLLKKGEYKINKKTNKQIITKKQCHTAGQLANNTTRSTTRDGAPERASTLACRLIDRRRNQTEPPAFLCAPLYTHAQHS